MRGSPHEAMIPRGRRRGFAAHPDGRPHRTSRRVSSGLQRRSSRGRTALPDKLKHSGEREPDLTRLLTPEPARVDYMVDYISTGGFMKPAA